MLIDFKEDSFYWVYILLVVFVVLLVILSVVLKNIRRKNYFIERKKANNELIECLGGFSNIVKATSVGSRLSLVLNDYNVINEDNLKKLGVSSIIKMSNKLTLVIGEESKDIALLIDKTNSDKSH